MDTRAFAESALVGWRKEVGNRLAERVAARTPLHVEEARALIGVVFFVLSALYVARTVRRLASRAA